VAQFGHLRRSRAGAHEVGARDGIPFARPVAGADPLARGVGRRRCGGGRFGRGGGPGAFGVHAGLRSHGVWIRRDADARRAALAEHGDTDHADVVGAPRARGVAVGQAGEVELRNLVERLAPAGDLGALPGFEDVAGLRGVGVLAGDRVDAVDRKHDQHAFAARVGQAHRVAVTRHAGQPAFAFVAVLRHRPAFVAIDDGYVHQRARYGRET